MKTPRQRRAAVLIKLLLVIGGVVAIGAGAVAALSGSSQTQVSEELFTVQRMDFDVTSTASGELEARQQTEIRSQVEGRATIVEIVEEGSFVDKGDLLVRLSDEEIKKNLDTEMLNYETAKSALTSAKNSLEIQKSDNASALRKAQLELELAELDLKKWREGDLKEKRNELELAIEKGERELERTKKKWERSKKLYEEEFLSEDQLELDHIAYIEAQSRYETAKLQKRVYETYTYVKEEKEKLSAVEEAKAELERVKSQNESQLANKDADLSKARQQAAIREERVNDLREQLENTVVRAPTDGLVVYETSTDSRRWGNDQGPLDIGREVRHNEGLIILPDTQAMLGVIKIHESLVSRISRGLKANVTIDAVPGRTFEGEVINIGIVASDGGWRDPNNREYDVKILLDCDGNEYNLKPSMRCEAEIIIESVEDALAIPVTALFTEGSTNYVYLEQGGRYKRQAVTYGSRSETYVEIASGLSEGDRVLMHEPSPSRIINEGSVETSDTLASAERRDRRGARSAGE